ncbi:RNF32 [Symbiodinium necroappetens]|uniref:RNF32 protein n=1 Tax=Symbiodinium necroappetens TaxID=1628268 RepID=A0A812XW71_9DINO|nr:RNF32 [Symbiodinium necroappetens]
MLLPCELSELGWFAESPKWPENLTIPAGFLFDIPDLRNLLSTAERQRVQDFKETVDEEIVPPENVSVTDGDCPVPFAIGGGCKCKEGCGGCSKAGCTPQPYLNSDFTSDTSLSCEGPWPPPIDLVAIHKTICGPRRVHKAFAEGKTTQRDGIYVKCEVGTLIGGACSKFLPYDGAEILAAFPDDRNTFRCLGTGEWSEEPVHYTVARGWCLELKGNEKVIMVRREGRDTASVQCPDGYQVVGGGCTFIEGFEFTLRESYPTSRNTWECVFDSTWSCGEGSPVCLRSEARAMHRRFCGKALQALGGKLEKVCEAHEDALDRFLQELDGSVASSSAQIRDGLRDFEQLHFLPGSSRVAGPLAESAVPSAAVTEEVPSSDGQAEGKQRWAVARQKALSRGEEVDCPICFQACDLLGRGSKAIGWNFFLVLMRVFHRCCLMSFESFHVFEKS